MTAAGQAAARPAPTAIGLLGGSFDPVHHGHLALARAALRCLPLAEVRLVPAAQPWQKGPLTDSAQRAQMVRLAIADEPGLVLDMHEIERGGPSYTIDTLHALRNALGAQVPLVLIIGADQLQRLDSWRDWQSIITLAHIAVAPRHGAAAALSPALQAFRERHLAPPASVAQQPAGALVEIDMPAIDVSATELRAALARPSGAQAQERLAASVAPAVLDYIRAHRLYR